MSDQTELKPCPFCGEKEDLKARNGYGVCCGNCGAVAGSLYKATDVQIKLWNTRAEEEWQPIETARKDGIYIWLADSSNRRVCWWSPVYEEWLDVYDLDRNGVCRSLYFKPTHWQNLPELPET